MEIKEAAADRVVIAKPVASKPTCSAYRSFSELLAGAINDSSPPRDPAVAAAIRPKTVRVAKPTPTPAAQPPPSVSQSRVSFLTSFADNCKVGFNNIIHNRHPNDKHNDFVDGVSPS
uniref:Uncharacterized protein n=1 Tax=Kalanchoe fedtschenkoi TaxID=63787 RepID=A0A7N0RH24_KALFE